MPHAVFSPPKDDLLVAASHLKQQHARVWQSKSLSHLLIQQGEKEEAFFLGLYAGTRWILKVAYPQEARWKEPAKAAIHRWTQVLQQNGFKPLRTNVPQRIANWKLRKTRQRSKNLEVTWRQVLKAGSWGKIFHRTAPLTVEIGFGSGEFLTQLASKHPKHNFVGIEISRESLRRAVKKIKALQNVRLLLWDGKPALRFLFSHASISHIYIHFPFPWDKKKQQKRRLVDAAFVRQVEEKLRTRGKFTFLTDSENYAKQVHKLFLKNKNFQVSTKLDKKVYTRYRRKWEKEGKKIYSITAVKTKGADEKIQGEKMEGVLASSLSYPVKISPEEAYTVFQPISWVWKGKEGTTVFKIWEAYKNTSKIIFSGKIIEPAFNLKQDFLLSLESEASSGEAKMGLFPAALPLLTPSLKAGIESFRNEIESRALQGKLLNVYGRLWEAYGPQHWWPYDPQYHLQMGGDPREEIIIGAILTQNTAWKNVEKSIERLKQLSALSLRNIYDMDETELQNAIRPSGYFQVKARKLKAFAAFFIQDCGGDWNALAQMQDEALRKVLLSVWGIGEETADSILLYAFQKPLFVVDAYTRRILQRLGLSREDTPYRELQALFHQAVSRCFSDEVFITQLYNEYHALLVRHGKTICLTQNPLCSGCPILSLCHHGRWIENRNPES